MVISSINTQPFSRILDQLNNYNLESDQLLILSGIPWEIYADLLQYLGDSPLFRVIYDQGILQIMSPSSRHEIDKENIGILLETYLLEMGIRFYSLGSTTWRSHHVKKGIEADKSYCFGQRKDLPDLAIEVVITSGGINTLTIYQALAIPEVWFWQNRRLKVHSLVNGTYTESNQSKLLPNLDLDLLTSYIEWDEPFDAVLEFKKKIKKID
ncbi:Uma2 family endonuclease [Crocosphaera sp. UHCC 0190]|uniref:Uma2 family endonuclease n=1 Tax=Crocosphaera sp. UHCC 0190 TaxID=3110246 RepID=UPI002B1EFEE3|nr:Uma2 family endonuclease [Crocosphaera sp. UHCC 0190]MEA5509692.1 Uma2 family endonuclease [Crocosphaera sp. UHCC 0190]